MVDCLFTLRLHLENLILWPLHFSHIQWISLFAEIFLKSDRRGVYMNSVILMLRANLFSVVNYLVPNVR